MVNSYCTLFKIKKPKQTTNPNGEYCPGLYLSTEIMTCKLERDVPANEPCSSVIYLLLHMGLWHVYSFVNVDFQGLQGEYSCNKGVSGRVQATKHPFLC